MKLPSKQDILADIQYWLYEIRNNKKTIIKKGLLFSLLIIPLGFIIWQLVYPGNNLAYFTSIDGVSLGGQSKEDAIKKLNKAYQDKQVNIYLGDNEKAFATPKSSEVGIETDNYSRVQAKTYPWYLRLVPTSIFWASAISETPEPNHKNDESKIKSYVRQKFGEQCRVEPINPSAAYENKKIVIKDGSDGGECKSEDVINKLADIKPTLEKSIEARLDVKPIKPPLEKARLERLVEAIERNLKKGVVVKTAKGGVDLEADKVREWLEFSVEKDKVTVSLNDRNSNRLLKDKLSEKVAVKAGVTKVTTRDFAETGRQEGAKGKELEFDKTRQNIVDFLVSKNETIQAATKDIAPKIEYIRTYSKSHQGLSALIKNYSDDKPGTYAVSMVELSGARRTAGVNENMQFATASTFKVYVAYSVLRRIDSGEYKWNNSIILSKNLSKCFEDMIVQSDNPCADALVKKIGYLPLHDDVQGLGLNNTTFIDKESFKTTAADLSKFMGMLESRQLPIEDKNRELFLEALRRNIYRAGIPAGVTSDVFDKPGFIDKLLHDTAIIHSPKGTYVLTIMTKDSSWPNIAELTKRIEELR